MNQNHEKYFTSLVGLCFRKDPEPEDGLLIDKAITEDSLIHEHLRLLPLLYKKSNRNLFSPSSWTKCKSLYKHTFYRNRMQLDRANRFQVLLKNHIDDELVAFKGIAFIANTCKSLGERPMSDIDFFSPHFPLNTKKIEKNLITSAPYIKIKSDNLRQLLLVDREGFEYDIHRLMHAYASNYSLNKFIKKNSIYNKILNYQFKIPCVELQFIHCLYHGILSPSIYYSKRWIIDAILLLEKNKLNDDLLVESSNYLDIPNVIIRGINEINQFERFIDLNLSNLIGVSARIKQKSFFIEKISLKPPRLEDSPPIKLGTLKKILSIFNAWLVLPLRWRKTIPIRLYYKKAIKKKLSLYFIGG